MIGPLKLLIHYSYRNNVDSKYVKIFFNQKALQTEKNWWAYCSGIEIFQHNLISPFCYNALSHFQLTKAFLLRRQKKIKIRTAMKRFLPHLPILPSRIQIVRPLHLHQTLKSAHYMWWFKYFYSGYSYLIWQFRSFHNLFKSRIIWYWNTFSGKFLLDGHWRFPNRLDSTQKIQKNRIFSFMYVLVVQSSFILT